MSLRIRTIARLSGVREPTLRAWERRYGFPAPQRSENGYRSYSYEELERVREVARLMSEGFAASEAIDKVRAAPVVDAAGVEALRARFWASAQALDTAGLQQVMADARKQLAPLVLCDALLMPLLGEMASRLDVAREHAASAVIRQQLRELEQHQDGLPGPRVVLACAPGDTHEGGVLGLALHLKARGFHTFLLGSDTPVFALRAACEAVKPELVALSFIRTREPAELRALLAELVDACDAPLVVGGAGVRDHGAMVLEQGAQLAETPAEVEALHAALKPEKAHAREA